MAAQAAQTASVKNKTTAREELKKDGEVCGRGPCPIERGMRLIGGKWKGSILWHLADGPVRFNDLARQLGGATRKMVNQRLKEMEEHGLVRRHVLSDRPIAVEYHITEFGHSALAVLDKLKDWADENDI